MPDEFVAKLFQDENAHSFEAKPLRFSVSSRAFSNAMEPFVASQRIELAARSGPDALQDLRKLLLAELKMVDSLIESPPKTDPPRLNEDVLTAIVTLVRQQKSQEGYAYLSHSNTAQLRLFKTKRLELVSEQPPSSPHQFNEVQEEDEDWQSF